MIDHIGVAVSDLHFASTIARSSMHFTPPVSRQAGATTANPVCARTIIPSITARSSSTRTVTMSKRSITARQ